METKRYYTMENYFVNRMRRFGRQMSNRSETVEEHIAWKNELRARLREAIGLNRMQTCDLKPEVLEKTACDGYTRRKIVIQTEPEVYMPFFMLVPDDIKPGERRPAVLAPHGHFEEAKLTVAGCAQSPEAAALVKESRGDYGVQLVREGFVVFCPDARGFGERRERRFQDGGECPPFVDGVGCMTCMELNRIAISLGQSVVAMWVWDLMRLIDYVQTCPECDAERLGCGGLSGGGLQTLWLMALDERVKAGIVSGYFYGFEDALFRAQVCCSCNYAPHVWEMIDVSDLAALAAPRSLTVETGTRDTLNGIKGLQNVIPYVERAGEAYALYGAKENLVHDIFEGEHRWNGERSIERIKRDLGL